MSIEESFFIVVVTFLRVDISVTTNLVLFLRMPKKRPKKLQGDGEAQVVGVGFGGRAYGIAVLKNAAYQGL